MRTIKQSSKCSKDSKIIVFYFPFKIVSGGPIFLSNLAIQLSHNSSYSVMYIEYKGGIAEKLLMGSKVNLIKYNDEFLFQLYPDEEILLITPIYWGNRVPILNPNSKILFFNWHNLCIPSLRTGLQCNDESLKFFLEMVSANNAEFYCDKAHWSAQEDFGISFNQIYVPITIPERKYASKKELVDAEEINIAVVGRLVIDKIYAITDLINNIKNDYALNKKINIYIIGDGDCREMILEYQKPEYINLILCGTLTIEEINEILSEKVDILFAMGTSALEGAAVGLPTVIIPNDIEPFNCDRYAYLYECNGYLLGWGPDQIDSFGIRTQTVGDILNQIYIENKKADTGVLCREYYKKNHSDNHEFLLNAIDMTTLRYKEYYTTICKVSMDAKKWARDNIVKLIEKSPDKEVVIWGAGKGGKQLLRELHKLNISVKYFIDKKADSISEIKHVPVKDPAFLNHENHLVLVSLLTYISDIPEELVKKGFEKGADYLYVHFPNY